MKSTETTYALLDAKKRLESLDTDKLFGSGIDITVHSFTTPDVNHVDRVTIAAEHFEPVRVALHEAVCRELYRRKAQLVSDIKAIDEATK